MHHSKAAAASLCGYRDRVMLQKHKKSDPSPKPHSFIALLQEPYHYKGVVKGLGSKDKLYVASGTIIPRACILTSNNVQSIPIVRFMDRDLVVIETKWRQRRIVFASAYMPGDSADPPPAGKLRDLVQYCSEKGLPLILGADANSHHCVWGSSDINARGEQLLDYLLTTDLFIVNKGNKPTFVNAIRGEVLDLTLANREAERLVSDWRVDDEESSSDHKYIRCRVRVSRPEPILRRNIRKTDWDKFEDALVLKMGEIKVDLSLTLEAIDQRAVDIRRALEDSMNIACPLRAVSLWRKSVSWWTPELTKLRKESRQQEKRTGKNSIEYVSARKEYHKVLRRAKRGSWTTFCKEIEGLPAAARAFKFLDGDRRGPPEAIRIPGCNGVTSVPGEVLKTLLDTLYPDDEGFIPEESNFTVVETELIDKIVTLEGIRKAVFSFSPYKAPGPDGIQPILLQKGIWAIENHLCGLFKACLMMGYVPKEWQESSAVWIPKAGKDTYEASSSWRPITLMSFLLKTQERLVDKFIRTNEVIGRLKINNQFAYIRGRSTEAALHRIVAQIEKALFHKQMALGVFVDIEGAFSNLYVSAITRSLKRFDISPVIIRWITFMLCNRTVSSVLKGVRVSKGVTRGCPQGGVLSPLLWNLVIDELLELLKSISSLLSQGFADDISMLQIGLDLDTLADRIQSGLKIIETWCSDKGLSTNPKKTDLILFTRKRNQKIKPVYFSGVALLRSTEARLLGLHLDEKLTWNSHVKIKLAKARFAMVRCRRMVGSKWGLSPRIVMWLYMAVVRPQVEYCAAVWAPALNKETCVRALTKFQRLGCLMITGAMPSTPTAALECLIGLLPLDIVLMGLAIMTRRRLSGHGLWKDNVLSCGTNSHSAVCDSWALNVPEVSMPSDGIESVPLMDRNFSVELKKRNEWSNDHSRLSTGIVCFTDGSRMNQCTGFGAFAEYREGNKDPLELGSLSESLGRYVTVYQGEVCAILCMADSLRILLSREGRYLGSDITVYSDSKSALQALMGSETCSELIKKCFDSLKSLALFGRVKLCWIPGHSGFAGNELADSFARDSTNMDISSKINIGLSGSTVRTAVRDWQRRAQTVRWNKRTDCQMARSVISEPFWGSKSLARLSRISILWLVYIYTGHCPLNKHLFVIGKAESPLCPLCGDEEETPIHLVGRCPYYMKRRFDHLGGYSTSYKILITAPVKDLLAFLHATERFTKSKQ
jgi:ribonuclease HI